MSVRGGDSNDGDYFVREPIDWPHFEQQHLNFEVRANHTNRRCIVSVQVICFVCQPYFFTLIFDCCLECLRIFQ